MMMKAGKLLSIGLLSAALFGCEQASEPATSSQVDGHKVGSAVNALSKTAARQAGYAMSYESADSSSGGFDQFSDPAFQDQLRSIGICENFIQLVSEFSTANQGTGQPTYSSRLLKVVQCLEDETKNMSEETSGDALFPVLDKCFCDGSGTVFGAIRAYTFAKYGAPQFNGYSAPATKGYGSPSAAPGYSAPAAAPGYSAPSL